MSVYDKIEAGEYKAPAMETFAAEAKRIEDEVLKPAEERYRQAKQDLDDAREQHRIARRQQGKAQSAAVGECNLRFMRDALAEAGLKDHPMADRAYTYAWEKGHSAGYHEVLMELQNIAGMILGGQKSPTELG